MNKKGNVIAIIILVGVMTILLVSALFFAFVGGVTLWATDIIVPEVSNLGVVGDANLTEIADYSVAPANSIIQMMSWGGGLLYIFGIIGCFGLAFAFRFSGEKWLAVVFVLFMLLVITMSIIISNMYQDFYSGDDEMATYLKDMTLLSWLILYSPIVLTVIGFICGIIMFSGQDEVYAL